MTQFGTPYGTPLNSTGFQGTQPGNAVGATLSPVNPGVGMFPPNADNRSGDTITASISRAACPANVDITNAGTRDSRPGRTVHESMSDANATGTSTVTNVAVDTVQTQVVTGTVVAKDGLTVALGGLITEGVGDSRAEVPVLGKLPVIGFFFRRQVTIRSRTELIVLIRPYVFNTPAESAALSGDLIPDNSLHPKAVNPVGSLNTFGSQEILRPDPPQNPLQTIFRSHSVDPLVY